MDASKQPRKQNLADRRFFTEAVHISHPMTLRRATPLQQGAPLALKLKKPANFANAKNAVRSNIPDRVPLPLVQTAILSACNMTRHPRLYSRLRKIFPQNNCPVLFQPRYTKELIINKAKIANCTPYENVKTSTDETLFQMDVPWSQKFTAKSQFGKTSVLSGTPPLSSKLSVLGRPNRKNPEHIVRV